jgi:lysophosphatidylcholine acyltransferase/lyso-PAF acetyltransferase
MEHNSEAEPSALVTIEIEDNQSTEALLCTEQPTSHEEEQLEKYQDVDSLYAPFVRPDYPIGWYEKFKLYFNGIFLVPFRVLIIVLLCGTFWILSKLSFIGLHEDKRTIRHLHGFRRVLYLCAGIFCRIGLFFSGFYIINRYYVSQKQVDKIRATDLKIKNSSTEKRNQHEPCVIVCNHISMIDIIVLLAEFNIVSFVALDRLKDTLLFGDWMQQINCLFVSDNNKKNLVTEIITRQEQYHQSLEESQHSHKVELPPRLVIFPEGTTTNGNYHILFHRGAFTAGLPVQPCMIRYPWNHFCPSWETIPITTYYARLLTQFRTYCYVIHFPVYYPSIHEQKDPAVYASNVRHVMTKCANRLFTKRDREGYRGGLKIVKVGNQTRKDKMSLHSRILKGEFDWTKNKNF